MDFWAAAGENGSYEDTDDDYQITESGLKLPNILAQLSAGWDNLSEDFLYYQFED